MSATPESCFRDVRSPDKPYFGPELALTQGFHEEGLRLTIWKQHLIAQLAAYGPRVILALVGFTLWLFAGRMAAKLLHRVGRARRIPREILKLVAQSLKLTGIV